MLVGAIECLRNGITTVQDMNSLVPQDEAVLDTILSAYAEVGIRVVFSIAVRDIAALDIAPFLPDDMPEQALALIRGKPGDPRAELDFVERQLLRLRPLPARFTWALSPSGPQRSSRTLLEGIGDLAARFELPIFTHVYETKAQTAKARELYRDHGGSMIRYLQEVGLLGHRTTIAHGVWLLPEELEIMAIHGTGLVHNPLSNLKLKKRRGADAPGAAGRHQRGAGLRQLQLRRLPEHVSGDEDAVPAGGGDRSQPDRRACGDGDAGGHAGWRPRGAA